jgi:hypothetical protein
MSKFRIEDILILTMIFMLVSNVMFSLNIGESFFPGQKYNSTSGKLEGVNSSTNSTYSAFTNSSYIADVQNFAQPSTDMANGLIDPWKLVGLAGSIIGLLIKTISLFSSGALADLLAVFIGSTWAGFINLIFNVALVYMVSRMIIGRLVWS